MSESIVDIPLRCLEQDPDNVRRFYTGIPLMAASIESAGLLENLVVERTDDEDRFVVRAGNRRLRALHHLRDEGKIEDDFPVPCKIAHDALFASGIENIARENLRPWEIGAHYLRCSDRGMGQKEIAAAHSRSQQHVSIHIRIARDLSPKVIDRLVALGTEAGPNLLELCRIAEHRDRDTLGPHTDKQLAELDRILGLKRQRKPPPLPPGHGAMVQRMAKRIPLLVQQDVPEHIFPYFVQIVEFLQGSEKELVFEEPARPKRAMNSRSK